MYFVTEPGNLLLLQGKLPLGLRLDTNAVQSSWKAAAGSQ
jgi:hypothetical protein